MNASNPHRRHRHYIDTRLQGRLLVWLIAGELLLFGVALLGVWWGMNAAVEASLYRVHQTQDSLPVLMRPLLWIVPVVLIVNLLAVAWGERRWRRRVATIVAQLEPRLVDIARGDLREPPSITEGVVHPVLEAAQAWQAHERARFAGLQRIIDALPEDTGADPDAAQALLSDLRHRLQDE